MSWHCMREENADASQDLCRLWTRATGCHGSSRTLRSGLVSVTASSCTIGRGCAMGVPGFWHCSIALNGLLHVPGFIYPIQENKYA
jgi:hypothetical protein